MDPSKVCRCQEKEILAYKNRLSAPLLDRIDLFVQMALINEDAKSTQDSKAMHEQVIEAFKRQKMRGQRVLNGKLQESEIDTFCPLEPEAAHLLEQASLRFGLSERAVSKSKKVARSVADLAGCEAIHKTHMLKALQFRKVE